MDKIFAYEKNILLFIQNNLRAQWLDPIVVFVTNLGNNAFIWLVIGLVMLINKKYRKTGITVYIALIIGAIITNILLKNIVQRVRPYETIVALKNIIENQTDWSFPSGHSTSSIAASLVMFKQLKSKWGVLALLFGITICMTRLYVGVHYPTDVLCGIIIGIASALFAIYIVNNTKAINKYIN